MQFGFAHAPSLIIRDKISDTLMTGGGGLDLGPPS
jgi:hypothetical protein